MVPFYFLHWNISYIEARAGAAMYLISIDSDRSQHEPTCCQSTRMNAQCVILCC